MRGTFLSRYKLLVLSVFRLNRAPNKRMHATRDTNHVMNLNRAGGRVMRSVMRLDCAQ